jgi:hypothetical protein
MLVLVDQRERGVVEYVRLRVASVRADRQRRGEESAVVRWRLDADLLYCFRLLTHSCLLALIHSSPLTCQQRDALLADAYICPLAFSIKSGICLKHRTGSEWLGFRALSLAAENPPFSHPIPVSSLLRMPRTLALRICHPYTVPSRINEVPFSYAARHDARLVIALSSVHRARW